MNRSAVARRSLGFAGVVVLAIATASGAAHGAAEPSSWPPRLSGQVVGEPVTGLSTPRLYVLTFHDAPVAEVADAVLGGALNLPNTVEPQVEGVMSFEVNERLTPPQLLERFEAALKSNGVAIRPTNSQFVLSPAAGPSAAIPTDQTALAAAPTPPAPRSEGWRIGGLLAACAVVGAASAVWMARRAQPRSSAREAVLAYLLESGAASRKQIARARLVAAREACPVETVLERDIPLPAEALSEAYSAAAGAPLWRPAVTPPLDPQPRYGEQVIGEDMLVLVDDGERLTVASADPLDDAATSRLLFASGRTIRLQVASRQDIAQARRGLRSLHVVGHVAG